jgi:hypothetical protein
MMGTRDREVRKSRRVIAPGHHLLLQRLKPEAYRFPGHVVLSLQLLRQRET